MNDVVLEVAIAKVLQSPIVSDEIEFLWHAGEPLAAGIEFYRKAVSFMRQYNRRQIKITNTIQTNGTLIDDKWCHFFSDNDFAIGISIDGPEFLHDASRKNWAGGGSHRLAMRGFNRLRDHGIVPGAICVLTRESLRYPSEIFYFFLNNGFRSLAFNVEEVENSHRQSSLSASAIDDTYRDNADVAEDYRAFMSSIYEYYHKHERQLAIREIEDTLSILSKKRNSEAYSRIPLETVELGIVTIHKNGNLSTFSPEFAGSHSSDYNDFIVGNILQDELHEIVNNETFKKIKRDMWEGIANCARECLFFDLCGSGYVSNKFTEHGSLKCTATTACTLHRKLLASVLIDKLLMKSRAHAIP